MALPDTSLRDLAEMKGCVQVIFFVETVSGSMLRSGYFLRLYFWIDALATVCPACLSAAVGRESRLLRCTADLPPSLCLRLELWQQRAGPAPLSGPCKLNSRTSPPNSPGQPARRPTLHPDPSPQPRHAPDRWQQVSMLFDIPLVVNRMGGNPDPLNGAGQHPLERQYNASWVWRTRSILRVTRILRLMRLVRLYQRYKVPAPPPHHARLPSALPGMASAGACMAAQLRPVLVGDLRSARQTHAGVWHEAQPAAPVAPGGPAVHAC